MEKIIIAPESPQSKLGRYAFADRRNKLRKLKIYEPDNAVEKKLLAAIDYHLDGQKKLSTYHVNLLRDFLKKNKYSDFFKEPTVKTIYRGMSMSDNMTKSILSKYSDIDIDKLKENDEKIKIKDINFLYKPLAGGASSWSKDTRIAYNFAKNSMMHDNLIVMSASVEENNNKLLDCKPFYVELGLIGTSDEREVISLGSIRVNSMLLWKV